MFEKWFKARRAEFADERWEDVLASSANHAARVFAECKPVDCEHDPAEIEVLDEGEILSFEVSSQTITRYTAKAAKR